MAPKHFITLAAALQGAQACSNFLLRHSAKTYPVSARTMDWGIPDLHTEMWSMARGQAIPFDFVPRNCTGHTCTMPTATAKYGSVYLGGLGVNQAVDGLNEAGLGVGLLALPVSSYPLAVSEDPRPSLPVYNAPLYLLSVCDTVACVKAEIEKYQIVDAYAPVLDQLGGFMGLHWTFHDANGESIIVEYVGNKDEDKAPECFAKNMPYAEKAGARTCIYDNNDGMVITNAPFFEQMREMVVARFNVTRLSDISTVSRATLKEVQRTSGSFDGPDRFSSLLVMQEAAVRANGRWLNSTTGIESFVSPDPSVDLVYEAHAMIGRVSRTRGNYDFDTYKGTTYWQVVRDHKSLRYYYRQPANPNLRMIEITKLDLGNHGLARPHVPLNYDMDRQWAETSNYMLLGRNAPTYCTNASACNGVAADSSALAAATLGLLVFNVLVSVGLVVYVIRVGRRVGQSDNIETTTNLNSEKA